MKILMLLNSPQTLRLSVWLILFVMLHPEEIVEVIQLNNHADESLDKPLPKRHRSSSKTSGENRHEKDTDGDSLQKHTDNSSGIDLNKCLFRVPSSCDGIR